MNFDNKVKVTGEEIFRVFAESFFVEPPTAELTLSVSGDGTNFIEIDEKLPANEASLIKNIPSGLYIKLVDNTGDLTVSY